MTTLPNSQADSRVATKDGHSNDAPMRILHVGNIANNAYNNAKVLVEAGIDCDVICYDYYHIMGCPEWEDADFVGTMSDHFKPDWSKVNLRGFQRPCWFAQGPRHFAIKYLIAKRLDQKKRSWFWWRLLSISQRRRRQITISVVRFVVRRFRSVKHFMRRCIDLIRNILHDIGKVNLSELNSSSSLTKVISVRLCIILQKILPRRKSKRTTSRQARINLFNHRVEELIERYDELFPDRPDRLTVEDFEDYRHLMPIWRKLFGFYDLIEAYSTDPILPMLAGVPYVAYEHGTIREIPFEENAVGRLTSLSYRLADAVVITNPDCVVAAQRLNVQNYRFIPHLIDRKYYDQSIRETGLLPAGVKKPYLFCPARHDWDIKGTHFLLHAFKDIAREHPDLQLVMSSWGTDLKKSRAWIRGHDLENRVTLVEPLHIHDLIRVVGQAEVLIDQFRYGVFGGIGPTALALGTPLVTHYDQTKSAWCMQPPPCHLAHDTPSCVEAIRDALKADPETTRIDTLEWMRQNYWHESVVHEHIAIFEDILHPDAHSLDTIEPKSETLERMVS